MDEGQLRDSVKFQIRRNVTNVFKYFLVTLEDLKDDFSIPESTYTKHRKRILDIANDNIREIDEVLNTLDIKFKAKNENSSTQS